MDNSLRCRLGRVTGDAATAAVLLLRGASPVTCNRSGMNETGPCSWVLVQIARESSWEG